MVPTKKLKDGNEIPILGFGTWQIEKEECTKAVKDALEIGYNHIDTAFAYYNEKYIAPAIKGKREQLFITSKLWRDFHHPLKVEEGCDHSLKDLQTDHLDLFLIHWPEKENMLDLLYEMTKLKEKGKIRSFGVCNSTKQHIQDIVSNGFEIVMNQIEIHPFLFQKDLIDFCHEQGLAVTAYSPIAQGEVFKNDTIQSIAKKHGKTPAQITLRWLLQHDLVVIPKASTKKHAEENFQLFDFALSSEEENLIDNLKQGKRIVEPDFNEFNY